jgi:hypothetical protein
MPGKRFSHYLIQLMLPVSFLAGNIFSLKIKKPGIVEFLFSKKLGYTILAILIVTNIILQKKDYYDKKDCLSEISFYLKKEMDKDDIIYSGTASQIIYFLLDTSPPTPYVHYSLIFIEEFNKILEINPEKELQDILNKKPRYILMLDGLNHKTLTKALNTDYILEKYFIDCKIMIYSLKDTE